MQGRLLHDNMLLRKTNTDKENYYQLNGTGRKDTFTTTD